MLKDAESRILASVVRGVDKAVELLKKEIDDRTPEDTGRLVRSNRQVKAVVSGQSVIGKVENDTPYAAYVEYGVGRAYNYHKPKGTVMLRGIGARMFSRAYDANKKKIVDTIANEVKKQSHA